LDVAGGVSSCDLELFTQLSTRLDPRRIFVVGNAYGLSTLALAAVFPRAAIDVIDAEVWGSWVATGTSLTRKIVAEGDLDVQLVVGSSPLDTPAALRGRAYDLVFIDGKHTHRHMVDDFRGIRPYLAMWSLVILHDVALCGLQAGVAEILRTHSEMQLHYLEYRGVHFENRLGTGMLVTRGDVSTWCDIASEPFWATFLQREKGK